MFSCLGSEILSCRIICITNLLHLKTPKGDLAGHWGLDFWACRMLDPGPAVLVKSNCFNMITLKQYLSASPLGKEGKMPAIKVHMCFLNVYYYIF